MCCNARISVLDKCGSVGGVRWVGPGGAIRMWCCTYYTVCFMCMCMFVIHNLSLLCELRGGRGRGASPVFESRYSR